MNEIHVKELVKLPQMLGIFTDNFKLWNYDPHNFHMPKFGLLTSRKMKKPNLKFFQIILFKYDAYIIQIKEGK